MNNEKELIDRFVKQASNLDGLSLVNLIIDATSHPSLYSFSEIYSVPNLIQLQGTEHSVYLDLLRIFADGTWTEYKSNASNLPQLVPEQILKLKQLTLLTLAGTNKVLPYDVLLQELDVVNVREFEDFLTGIVRDKLDQFGICFQVQCAAGRDLRPGKLESIRTLSKWSSTSDNLPTEPYMIYLRFPPLSSEHPWAVLQNPKDDEEVDSDDQMFYAMGPIIKNNLPRFHCRLRQLHNKQIQGFFHGWVLLSDPARTNWFFWNAATSTEIILPSFPLTDSRDSVDCFKHFCLSSTPDDPSSVFLLARSDRPSLLICQLDNREWTEVSYRKEINYITLDSSGILHNLTCFEGNIFALCSDTILGTVVVRVEIISKDGELTIILNRYVYGPIDSPRGRPWRSTSRLEQLLKGAINGLYYIELEEFCYACLYKLETCAMIWEPIFDLKDAIFYVDLDRSAVFYSVVTDSESSGYIHFCNPSEKVMWLYNVKEHTIMLWRGPHTQETNVNSLWECSPPHIEEMVSPSFSYQRRCIRLCEGGIHGFKSFNIRGFFYDWVVLSSNANIQWSLWNQKTSNVISLPTLDLDVLDCEAIKQCCLSASPHDPNSVFLLMRTDKPTFLVCPLHTREWTEISYAAQLNALTRKENSLLHDITSRRLHSITYSDGKLYVLNSDISPLVIEVKTKVIHGKVDLRLLLCGLCPFISGDHSYYLKGHGVDLFCIIVKFDNERKSTVRKVSIYRIEKVAPVKNLDMRYWYKWNYNGDDDDGLLLALTMRWEKLRDFKGTFLVDLSRNYSVFYEPESGFRGQVELHHPTGRVVYKYCHEDQAICVSCVPDGTPTTCLSLWECRAMTDRDGKMGRSGGWVMVTSVNFGMVETDRLYLSRQLPMKTG